METFTKEKTDSLVYDKKSKTEDERQQPTQTTKMDHLQRRKLSFQFMIKKKQQKTIYGRQQPTPTSELQAPGLSQAHQGCGII